MTEKNNILEKKLPYYVNWEVINKCNMGCPYCFLGENPQGSIKELSTEQGKELIDRVYGGGGRLLNFAGGEPLMRQDLAELIKYSKHKGFTPILSTNGILLDTELIGRLEESLVWISLPLDGYSAETHDSIRGRKGHFEHVLSLLNLLEDSEIKIKINTMVCKNNLSYVDRILDVLGKYRISKVKLFQFSARGKAERIRDKYEISDKEFLDLERIAKNSDLDVVMSTNKLRNGAYLLINPAGKASIPYNELYLDAGNILNKVNLENLDFALNLANAEVSYDFGGKK